MAKLEEKPCNRVIHNTALELTQYIQDLYWIEELPDYRSMQITDVGYVMNIAKGI